jgi:hypothetical protein
LSTCSVTVRRPAGDRELVLIKRLSLPAALGSLKVLQLRSHFMTHLQRDA